MVFNNSFEITEVAGEYIVVPIGEAALTFKGVIALNEASAFLCKQLYVSKTRDELIDLLMSQYDVEYDNAKCDVDDFVNQLSAVGAIKED